MYHTTVMPNNTTIWHTAAVLVALVNEYMLTFFTVLSFHMHAS